MKLGNESVYLKVVLLRWQSISDFVYLLFYRRQTKEFVEFCRFKYVVLLINYILELKDIFV